MAGGVDWLVTAVLMEGEGSWWCTWQGRPAAHMEGEGARRPMAMARRVRAADVGSHAVEDRGRPASVAMAWVVGGERTRSGWWCSRTAGQGAGESGG